MSDAIPSEVDARDLHLTPGCAGMWWFEAHAGSSVKYTAKCTNCRARHPVGDIAECGPFFEENYHGHLMELLAVEGEGLRG